MEGVGARLGRSSTRYSGPATVFTGPVRKWKKKWVPVPNPNNNSSNNNTHSTAGVNNNNSAHLLLYKWTPLTPTSNSAAAAANGNGNNPSTPAGAAGEKDLATSDAAAAEEPPPRKLRYMPIAVPEEPKQEMEEDVDDESTTPNNADLTEDEKPDVNEVSVEDAEALEKERGKEANGTHLDLNLGLKSHDGKRDDDGDDGDDNDDDVQMKSPTLSESGNRGKRKAPDLN